jgi:hypothetical protein
MSLRSVVALLSELSPPAKFGPLPGGDPSRFGIMHDDIGRTSADAASPHSTRHIIA